MKVVVIGSGAAGLTAASNIRKYDENAEITVITREKYLAYSPCAIPYVLGGEIESFESIIMHEPEDYKKKGINVVREAEVYDIVSNENKVDYRVKKEEKELNKSVHYDYLVIAAGGTPFIPPVEGIKLKGVFKVRTIEDGVKIREWAENCKKAVVIGAGAIGLETGYELKKRGLDVAVTEMLPQIFPRSLDPDMARIVQKYLESRGVKIILGNPVGKILGEEKVETAVVDNETLETDMVIMATGVRPQVNLAKQAGCKLGRWAVEVNEKMQTSIPNIYAAGDCVEVVNAITGQNTLSPFGTTAVRQGKVAAKNITGRDTKFNSVLNSSVSKIGAVEIGAVGLTETAANLNGIQIVTGKIKALTRARYYPGCKPIYIKLICSSKGRILGCQIIAKETVAERVDTMAMAISKGVTCNELIGMEFSYAPPLSMVVDPFVQAAEDACEKLKNNNIE